MPRKASPIGPHVLALIEDARVDLARATLVVREGDNEPDFNLPEDVPGLADEEAVEAFRQSLIQILSGFDQDDLRPAEQRSRRIRALAEKKGVTSLTTIVEQQLDDAQSQEFDRQPDELCRSIWTYLHARETFEDAENFHFARQFRDHGRLYDAFEVELENHVALDAAAIDETALATKIKGMLELKPEISCTVKALDLPATDTHPASIMLIVRHGGPLSSVYGHRHDGRRGTIYYRPPNEATLIYKPSLRQIEAYADSLVVRQTVSDSFAEVALGHDISQKPLTWKRHNLSRFRTSLLLQPPEIEGYAFEFARVVEAEIRLGTWPRHRPRCQPVQRLLRSEVLRELCAVLLPRLARRRDPAGLSRGDVPVLGRCREQPTVLGLWRPNGACSRMRGLDLERAALSVLPRAHRCLDGRAELAARPLADRPPRRRFARSAVRHLCLRAGLSETRINVTGLWGAVEGYAIGALESPRASITTLARHFGFDAVETEGVIRFVMRGRAAVATVSPDDLVAAREGDMLELTRGQETELPQALKWQVACADEDHEAAQVEARRITVDTTRIASEFFPMAAPPEEAERCCRRALMEAWTGRESAVFRLPPSRLALDPADVVTLAHDGRAVPLRFVSIADADAQSIEAVRQDREAYTTCRRVPRDPPHCRRP